MLAVALVFVTILSGILPINVDLARGPVENAVREFGTEGQNVAAGGVGFRYRIARKLGMQVGMDVARGPEDTSIYLTVGSAW